ncbi:MAG: hypothetical protein ABH874_06390 [Methanobacteriota archaeon]
MIKIIAPATSANLGPGFDVFGIALEQPFDVMKFRERSEGIKIKVKGFEVPTNPKENVAGIVASGLLKKFDRRADSAAAHADNTAACIYGGFTRDKHQRSKENSSKKNKF